MILCLTLSTVALVSVLAVVAEHRAWLANDRREQLRRRELRDWDGPPTGVRRRASEQTRKTGA